MLGCSGPSKRVILLYLCPKFLTFSPRQVCWQSTWWGGFSWLWLVSWRDLILNCLLISGTPGVKCLKMSSEQDGQHGSSVLDNRSILLISLPLLSLFSEGDTCSLLNSMNVSDKVSEPYIKVSIQNLGVGVWSLWVHSLLWYMSERGLTYYLQSKVFQNQKHIFSEELITENLFLYSLNRTCQHIQLALSKGDQRWL